VVLMIADRTAVGYGEHAVGYDRLLIGLSYCALSVCLFARKLVAQNIVLLGLLH